MTLGAQYDWTAKNYASQGAPAFPRDIAHMIQSIFPNVRPDAAIMNLYNPGDYLSMHRDVSEECDNGLVSISLGCEGIFMVALQAEDEIDPRIAVFRLYSGDVLYLSGLARFAWHGLAQIIPETCPDWLHEWPTESFHSDIDANQPNHWQGFMKNKRVNLSVRQVKE